MFLGRELHTFWLSVEKPCFAKTKKTTKLMKHLGGSGKMDYVEWLRRSHIYGGRVYLT
jgi:hypothetical protein